MDKQMIEEMVQCKALFGLACNGKLLGMTCSSCQFVDKCVQYCRAKEMYEEGIRKIPEGGVVLTREEYEKLQALKDDYVKGYEAGVEEGWENARKETAEKFAERLKAKLSKWLDDNEDLNFKIDKGIAIIELIGVETL